MAQVEEGIASEGVEARGAMMRAAVVREFGSLPNVEEVPFPVPGPNDALIAVRAAGLCATDLKLIKGALAGVKLPRIPGHEVAGVVEACESNPSLVGRRVACHLYDSCGECPWCVEGRETLCRAAVRIGIERDGGLASYVTAGAKTLIPFDDSISFEHAAVAMDAVTTPWGGLHGKGRIQAGDRVLIVGCGGLGSNAVQIAREAGTRVAVVDPVPGHRQLGTDFGAELALDPAEHDQLDAWAPDGVDVALETSGVRNGFDIAVAHVRPGGRIVCNGYQPDLEYGIDSAQLVLEEVEVVGSRVASRDQAAACLQAVGRGEVVPQVMDVWPLDRVAEALELLAAGGVDGRLVIRPGDGGKTIDPGSAI